MTEYEEAIVRKLVEKVVVGNDDVEIMLESGKTMKLQRYESEASRIEVLFISI